MTFLLLQKMVSPRGGRFLPCGFELRSGAGASKPSSLTNTVATIRWWSCVCRLQLDQLQGTCQPLEEV